MTSVAQATTHATFSPFSSSGGGLWENGPNISASFAFHRVPFLTDVATVSSVEGGPHHANEPDRASFLANFGEPPRSGVRGRCPPRGWVYSNSGGLVHVFTLRESGWGYR